MTAIHTLTPVLLSIALVSCTPPPFNPYESPNPYGTATTLPANPPTNALANAPASAPANPVYDTPAAYEESSSPTPDIPVADTSPAARTPSTPPAPHGAALIHTVVAGDTLSGISAKYQIPSASIKQANRMTNDTVMLGRKMVIPPR
jgi:LysM repeat protein